MQSRSGFTMARELVWPGLSNPPEDIIRGKFEARLAAALGLPIYPAAEAKTLDDLLEIVEYRTFLCAQEDEPTGV